MKNDPFYRYAIYTIMALIGCLGLCFWIAVAAADADALHWSLLGFAVGFSVVWLILNK